MKTCITCNQTKPLSDFFSNGLYNGKKKYKPTCKDCEQHRRIERHWKKIESILGDVRCSRCGYDKNLAALEFHHEDPDAKEAKISDMKCASLEVLRKELEKCEILCSNCHREEHRKNMTKERILVVEKPSKL